MRLPRPLLLACLLALCLLPSAVPTRAGTPFLVTSTADMVDAVPGDGVCATASGICTLRAAIQEANTLGGAHTISLPAGTYLLTLAGALEDAAAQGDLDITTDLTIAGAGTQSTIIDANGLDRVFQVFPPTTVLITGVTIQHGSARCSQAAGSGAAAA